MRASKVVEVRGVVGLFVASSLWLAGLAATGCAGSADNEDEASAGQAQVALTQAPADTRCIRITVVGTRTVTRLAAVTPGQATVLPLGGLPVGDDLFAGDAFPLVCASVVSTSVPSVPTWVSDPVTATVTTGAPVDVSLVFRPNGRGAVAVDFQHDGAGGAPGTLPNTSGCDSSGCVCLDGFADCDGTFVNGCEIDVASDAGNCGVCGHICEAGASCIAGACTVIQPLSFTSACTDPSCTAVFTSPFAFQFSATGGVPPYTWETHGPNPPVVPDAVVRSGPPAFDAAQFGSTGLFTGPATFCINCSFFFEVCVNDAFGRHTCRGADLFTPLF